jgi:hypothetical protein
MSSAVLVNSHRAVPACARDKPREPAALQAHKLGSDDPRRQRTRSRLPTLRQSADRLSPSPNLRLQQRRVKQRQQARLSAFSHLGPDGFLGPSAIVGLSRSRTTPLAPANTRSPPSTRVRAAPLTARPLHGEEGSHRRPGNGADGDRAAASKRRARAAAWLTVTCASTGGQGHARYADIELFGGATTSRVR